MSRHEANERSGGVDTCSCGMRHHWVSGPTAGCDHSRKITSPVARSMACAGADRRLSSWNTSSLASVPQRVLGLRALSCDALANPAFPRRGGHVCNAPPCNGRVRVCHVGQCQLVHTVSRASRFVGLLCVMNTSTPAFDSGLHTSPAILHW